MKILFLLLVIGSAAALAEPVQRDVVYKVDGQAYQGYYTSPDDGSPLVIILHDWDGLTDYERRRARMLARQGYSAFAADLFGKGNRPTAVDDKRQHTGELYRDRKKMRRLLTASLKAAGERGANIEQVVVIGYCFGGAAALEWARSGADLRGFVSIHGGLSTPEGQGYGRTKGKILIQHGAADSHIDLEDFIALTRQLEQHRVVHEVIAYGGAPHAWTVFGSERYRRLADARAWERLLDFLRETLQRDRS